MVLKILEDCLLSIEDKRQGSKVRHPLRELIFLVFCGVLSGCDDYEDIVFYGEEKIDFLRQYFPYKNGIASVPTLSRLFSWLSPKFFLQLLQAFLSSYFPDLPKDLISIDGKTSRGSRDGALRAAHHLTAFSSHAKLVLSHIRVDCKTNEITAIPDLIETMNIEGAMITIDAMGCQRDIAELIICKKGEYLLGLKANQGRFHQDAQDLFPSMIENKTDYHVDEYEETEPNGGGRIETRKITLTDNIMRLNTLHAWPGLKSVIKVERSRDIKGKKSFETSFYLSSKIMTAEEAARSIRSHWAIENSLHYVLDVAFCEDKSRVRKDNAPENMNILRKIITNIIQMLKKNAISNKEKKRSFKIYRKKFLISDLFFHKFLRGVNS